MDMDRTEFIKENIKKEDLVLDIGCSEGFLHQEIFGKNVVGLDIKTAKNKENFVKGDALFIPFKESILYTAVVGELMEHLEDPELFFRECKRVLKKNGVLILTTPNKNSWVNRIFKSYQHEAHISLFDINSLRKLVSKYFSEETFFLLPYDEVSSWGSKHKKFFWVRKLLHHFLPKNLQEEIIIKCLNDR